MEIKTYEEALKAAELENCIADDVIHALYEIAVSDAELWQTITDNAKKEDLSKISSASNLTSFIKAAEDMVNMDEVMEMEKNTEPPTIDRFCGAEFMFAIDDIEEADLDKAKTMVENRVKEYHGKDWVYVNIELLDSDSKDNSAVFAVEYQYVEKVPIIVGYGGSYIEPPEPDEYDMEDEETTAWQMGKAIQRAWEDCDYTVGDWVIEQNEVESEQRLDDKQRVTVITLTAEHLAAGATFTETLCGEYDLTIAITKASDFVPPTKEQESQNNRVDIKVTMQSGYTIGTMKDVQITDAEYALNEIFKGTATVDKGKEISVFPDLKYDTLEDVVETMGKKSNQIER